ncbi:hypothetical protein LNO13_26420 [Klebsiella variicola subsp. variicola]|nr:hypothetical protein [Klebsiella variicola subsp. variicola]
MNYHTAFRKQNNTETEVAKYTNTTICARHHSGKKVGHFAQIFAGYAFWQGQQSSSNLTDDVHKNNHTRGFIWKVNSTAIG